VQQAENEKASWIGVIMILVASGGRMCHRPSTEGDERDPYRQSMGGRNWVNRRTEMRPGVLV
jgi:hypothetical protein